MARPDYPAPSQFRTDALAWVREIAIIVKAMRRGSTNTVGDVTLVADGETTQTVVIDDRCHTFSSIVFDPLSEEAAAVLHSGGMFVTAADRIDGQFTISHPEVGEGEVVAFYYTIQG